MSQINQGTLNTNPIVQTTPEQLRAAKEQIAQEQIKEAGARERLAARRRLLKSPNDFPTKREENIVKYTRAIPKKIIHDNQPAPAPSNVVSKPNIEEQSLGCLHDFNTLFNIKNAEYCKIWDRQHFRAAISILQQAVGCASRQCYSWGWQIFKQKGVSFDDSKMVKKCDIVADYMTPILRHIILTRTIAGSSQWKLNVMKQFIDGKYHDAPQHNTNVTEHYVDSIVSAISLLSDLKHIGNLIKNDPDQPCLVAYMNIEEGYEHITKIIKNLKTVVEGLSDHLEKVPLPVMGF